MAILNEIARQTRITTYKDKVKQRLVSKIIDFSKVDFIDLIADRDPDKPMVSLQGVIILERDLREDGSLKGVVSVDVDDLAAMLPDIKKDTGDKMGWKKWLDQWKAEGLPDILKDVADPTPGEYELSATEELATLDIDSMSDAEAKQKLKDIKSKAA